MNKLFKRFDIQKRKIFTGQSSIKKNKPQLFNVHVKDNKIELTNGIVAIRYKTDETLEDTLIEDYPELDELFNQPINSYNDSITLEKEKMKMIEDQLNVLYRNEEEVIDIEFDNYELIIKSTIEESLFKKSVIPIKKYRKKRFKTRINSRYVHDALMFLRQMNKEKVELMLPSTSYQPILFHTEDLDYLIMTIRP